MFRYVPCIHNHSKNFIIKWCWTCQRIIYHLVRWSLFFHFKYIMLKHSCIYLMKHTSLIMVDVLLIIFLFSFFFYLFCFIKCFCVSHFKESWSAILFCCWVFIDWIFELTWVHKINRPKFLLFQYCWILWGVSSFSLKVC